VRFVLTLMLAALIAIGMKIVGMLLIVSLLVIPAAGARQLARTPEEMAAMASLLGMLAVMGGLLASLRLDLPTGPAIVACAALLFVAASLGRAAAARAGFWRWRVRPPTLPPSAGDGP
jgi:zinc transport system permease protein